MCAEAAESPAKTNDSLQPNLDAEEKKALRIPRPVALAGRAVRFCCAMIGLTVLLILAVEGIITSLPLSSAEDVAKLRRFVGEPDAQWPEILVAETRAVSGQFWPYTYWRMHPQEGLYVNVDEAGLRATWQPPAVAPEEKRPFRIFLFGGSTMFATGSRDDKTIPSFLGKKLAALGYNAEVSNFGQVGYVSSQEVLMLLWELQRGNVPDVAIFYDGNNDVASVFQNGRVGGTINEPRRRILEDRMQQLDNLFDGLWDAFASSRSAQLVTGTTTLEPAHGKGNRIAAYAQAKWEDPRVKDAYRQELARLPASRSEEEETAVAERLILQEMARDVIRLYNANMRTVQALETEFGFRAIFYWQPLLFEKSQRTALERELEVDPQFEQLYRITHEVARDTVGRQSEFAREVAAAADRLIYIGDLFSGEAWNEVTLYRSFGHLLDVGNDAVAQRMLADVVPLIEEHDEAESTSASSAPNP